MMVPMVPPMVRFPSASHLDGHVSLFVIGAKDMSIEGLLTHRFRSELGAKRGISNDIQISCPKA